MILPLRRAHRSAFVALAILLPALLASAWKVRRGPVGQDLPAEYLPRTGVEGPIAFHAYELVYWTRQPSDELASDAELVGTVGSGALDLQPPAGMHVVVYSLAHDRVFNDGRDLAEAYPGESSR